MTRQIMRGGATAILALLALMLTFGIASAASAATADGDLSAAAKPVLDALLSGNYVAATAFVLVLVCAAINQYGGKVWAPLSTDYGRAATVLGAAFAGSIGHAALTGPLTLAIVWSALHVAAVAAGGYSLLKPLVTYAERRLPWLKPITSLVGALYRKSDPVAGAAAAGDAAVAANPSAGATGVVSVRDVD